MKMNRRKALIGIGSLAVGSGAALGSGAFTSVEASRSVDVTVTDDSTALLAIGPAGPYTSDTSSNENAVTLNIGGGASTASGLNDDAVTELGEVIELTNNSEAGQGESSAPAVDVNFLNDSGNTADTVGVEVGGTGADATAVVVLTAPSTSISSTGTDYVTATVYTGSRTDDYSGGLSGTQGSVTIDATDTNA